MDVHPSQRLKEPHTLDDLEIEAIPSNYRNFIEYVINSRDFIQSTSEREQVFILFNAIQENEIPLGIRTIANFFNVGKSTIQHHLKQSFNDKIMIGRPPLLTQNEHEELKKYIQQGVDEHYPRNYLAIRNFIFDVFGKSLELDSIRHYIKNNPDFRVVRGSPIESLRSFSSDKEIDNYFNDLKELFGFKIPSKFVFNIDEVGFNEYFDTKSMKCIVPQNYIGNSIYFAADRNSSHSTMLAGIAADGSSLIPLLILERDTFELELYNFGYTSDKLMLAHSDSGYINERLFNKWAKDVFFKEVRMKRNISNYPDPAVLIFNNLHAHTSDDFVTECQEEQNIIIKPIPPHTSDQIQPLDLGIFGNLKHYVRSFSPPRELNKQTQKVIQIYDAYRTATSPKNVVGAFRVSGIISIYNEEVDCLMVDVNTEYARHVRHFQQESACMMKDDKKRFYMFK